MSGWQAFSDELSWKGTLRLKWVIFKMKIRRKHRMVSIEEWEKILKE